MANSMEEARCQRPMKSWWTYLNPWPEREQEVKQLKWEKTERKKKNKPRCNFQEKTTKQTTQAGAVVEQHMLVFSAFFFLLFVFYLTLVWFLDCLVVVFDGSYIIFQLYTAFSYRDHLILHHQMRVPETLHLGIPRENPCWQVENLKTPHKKASPDRIPASICS